MNTTFFYNKDGTLNEDCVRYHNIIKNYAEEYNLKCTLRSLGYAEALHKGAFRDGNGAPYIIHPLEVTHYLIILNVRNAIYDMKLGELHNTKLAEEATLVDLDVLLSVALLHDVLEDCINKFDAPPQQTMVKEWELYPEIYEYVNILTKDKNSPDYSPEGYFNGICDYWVTTLIKFGDRTNNCSSINAFNNKRMENYVCETVKFFYPMSSKAKTLYPDFSRIITIMKYFLVAVCETASASLNIKIDMLSSSSYEKTYSFLKGFSIRGNDHQNTLKALPLAKKYYFGLTRKTGDPLIIHPLRVASYLVSLKIDDDVILASALLHEIIKKSKLKYNGIEIVTKYHLDSRVLDYVRLLSNSEHYPLDIYYDAIKCNSDVLLLKLSNRAHTCTILSDFSDEEIRQHVEECEKYIYPLCEYGMRHYPQYSYSIQIMYYHIRSITNIVKSVKKLYQ